MMESVSRHHRHHPNRHRHDHAIWDVYGVYAFYSVCDDVYCDDRNKNNNVNANSCYDNESCHRTGYNMLNRV